MTIERRLPGDVSRSLSVADVLELTVAEAVQLFRDDREVVRRAAADRRRRPRVREARPAGADALRRRGAAPQARRLPRRGGAELERQPAGAGPARHALHVRRADHRAALRRHRQADALVPEAPGGGPLDRRHRAQPRRHPRLRLADRPRPRGRRGRRRARRLRHAGGREAPRHVAHRQGAARLRRRPRLRGPRGRGRAAAAAPAQAGARAPRRGREHPHRQRPRAQPEVDRRLASRAASSASSPASPARASRRSPSTSCSTRASAATSSRSTPTPARSSSRPAGPRSTRSTASRRPSRSSSGCRAAGGRARSPRPPRSGTSCACSTSSSGCSTASRTAPRCGRRASSRSRRRSCATMPASTSACSRRWWWRARASTPTSPSGPRARGHSHLRVDGEFVKVDPWPRLDRFKEHTLELPVGDVIVDRANEAALRALLDKALDVGKGVLHLLAPLTGLHGAMLAGTPTRKVGAVKVFSTRRACPTCGTSYPELDPRMFSYNSKHGWCTTCVGTGLKLTREQRKAYDDSIRDDDDRGREQSFPAEEAEVEGVVDEPCPECAGTRLNPASRAVTFDDKSIAWIAQWSVGDARTLGRVAGARRPRGRDRARRRHRDQEPAGVPRGGGPRLPDPRPRRADALRRRGAAHPPRGAARQQPAGRVLRARRADDRPALARQRDPARRAART